MAEPATLADEPKKAVEDYLREIREEYEPWYGRSAHLAQAIWLTLHVTSLLAGFATAILAALASDVAVRSFGTIRILLIVLPALGAAASTLVAQSRVQEWCRFREAGRQAVQSLLNYGKARFAAGNTDEHYTRLHAELNERITEIEAWQGAGWIELAMGRAATTEPRAPSGHTTSPSLYSPDSSHSGSGGSGVTGSQG